ncbi:MAG: hypothetical protein EOP48_27465 [Sphingobacteriales bacterium]|nr:MAG: hypothetical protein EOP48_27465 [Sphingobacteriales bacterium]
MEEKYTLRDLFVYTITGLCLPLSLFLIEPKKYSAWIINNKDFIKDNGIIVLVIGIPALYLLGHLIQAVDILRLEIGTRMFKKAVLRNCAMAKFFYLLLLGDRLEGVLLLRGEDQSWFWKKVNYNIIQGHYTRSEYWYILKDLCNNLETLCLCLSFYTFFWTDTSPFWFLGLSIIFWVKSRTYTKTFIRSVEDMNWSLNNSK